MRRATLERMPAMDAGRPGAPRASGRAWRPARRRRGARRRWPCPRAIVSVNGVYQSASHTFSEKQTFDAPSGDGALHLELRGEVGAERRRGRVRAPVAQLGAGVAFTSFKDDRDITIEGTLPHPFCLRPRRGAISGTAPGTREETAVHPTPPTSLPSEPEAVELLVFGGPSFFTVKQSVVDGRSAITESYPYDTATFTSATVQQEKESKVGFNVGADVGYYFTKYIGVGGIVRFSRASIPFSLGDLDVGGAMVGGGVRIRIP